MPDSPPQTRPNDEQRFAIGVTRVCLASGTLQIPFAMRGIFEPGTYPVLDTQRNETAELVFDPPRSLRGLDEIFAAHELHPNDEVILTLTDDGLELDVKKRPRRKAQQAKGEPWESVSGAQRRAATPQDAPQDAPTGAPERAHPERGQPERGQPELFGRPATRAEQGRAGARPAEPEDDDAPRIVRARRVGRGEDRPRMEPPAQERSGPDAPERAASGPSERRAPSESAARRFFEDPGDPDDPYAADAFAEETWQWERPETEAPERPEASGAAAPASGGFLAKIAQAARGAFSFRGPEEDFEDDYLDASAQRPEAHGPREANPERRTPAPNETRPTPRRDTPDAHAAPERRPAASEPRPRPEPAQRTPDPRPAPAPEAAPAAKPRNVVVEDAEADAMDQSGPAMWELGEGDLRQRLIRFLQHPDVPVILRTELVARNLGLGQEVADAMLEDLSHDKIDGLVVTKVRDDTYRISRAPSKL